MGHFHELAERAGDEDLVAGEDDEYAHFIDPSVDGNTLLPVEQRQLITPLVRENDKVVLVDARPQSRFTSRLRVYPRERSTLHELHLSERKA